jgi:hypothetical protein
MFTVATTGTVSNIIDEWKKGIQDSNYESIREFKSIIPPLLNSLPLEHLSLSTVMYLDCPLNRNIL